MLTFPQNPHSGDLYSTGSTTYIFNGVAWVIDAEAVLSTDRRSLAHVGASPPSQPLEGQLWFRVTNLKLYIYLVDGSNNAHWFEV